MERDEFLKSLGIGLAMVCTGTCLQSCSKGGNDEASPGTNNNNGGNNSGSTASVDISTLSNIGSKTTVNGVLFFRIASGNQVTSFIATEPVCTHEGGNLSWLQAENRIKCSNHGAEFSTGGAVLLGPATRALKMYTLALNGNTLVATKA